MPLLARLESFTVDLNEKGNLTEKSFKVHILVTETSEAGTSACGRGGWIKTQPLSPSGISESDNMCTAHKGKHKTVKLSLSA